MNKNDLANIKNFKADRISRILTTDYELDFTEGSIYDNLNKAESWSYDGTQNFIPETEGKYIYVLYCDNVNVHKVDYSNKEECEILGCEDCKSEGEVLVSADTKMRIIREPQEVDFEEMGYYTVELEVVEEV